MYPPDFEKRLEKASRRVGGDVNCHGVTFYLLGLQEEEIAISAKSKIGTRRFEQNFDIVSTARVSTYDVPPKAEAFAVWLQDESDDLSWYLHSGVIHPFDRTKIIQRFNTGHPISIALAASALNLEYYNKFLTPPSFAELRFLRLK
jgi:hypothetical protein